MSQSDRATGTKSPDADSLSGPHFARIDFARPAGTQIFEALKTAVLKMDLPPGCVLSESEIGSKFGASRTPVREAFMQLREAGLVTTLPSRGNFVTRLNREKILEARFLREAIEVANVCRLVEIGMEASFKQALQANLAAQGDAIAQENELQFRLMDDHFHSLLAEATGYPRVAHVLEREKMLLDRLRSLALRDKGHQSRLLREHAEILEAVLSGDLLAAVTNTRRHLSSILETLSSLEARHQDYFD